MTTETTLTDEQIEHGRHDTFSTNNPFCPCDSKTMRKAARWAERAVLQSPEVRALREDAARYQWLKANGSMSVDSFVDKYRVVDASISLVITDWMDSFDEAIDAAMETQP